MDGQASNSGFTLIEVMISMTISLVVLAALVSVFVNTSRSSSELANTNALIDNGRFSVQLLEQDLVHAGFLGGYLPQFDNLSATGVPGDVPDAVPDPCKPFSNWHGTYRNNLLGIPLQSYETLPAGAGCLAPLPQRAGTDVLVVRHADLCVPGVGNCDADVAGQLYLQPSFCGAEQDAGTAQAATANTIRMAAGASTVNGIYNGLSIHISGGMGAGQSREIVSYAGGTRLATVTVPWSTIPDITTTYSFDYMLGIGAYPLHKRDCLGTGTPATLPVTGGTLADKRRLISNIYYISDVVDPDRAGEVVPTLVRSQFGLSGGILAHQPPVALIEGIEGFRVALGVDNLSDSGTPVDYSSGVTWADPALKTSPTNRGDGTPDEFVSCTDAAPCTAGQLTNVVAVNLFVLARSRDRTPGYTDTKTYCLGEFNPDGSCPPDNQIPAANDQYKRHVFATSVRLINVAGRRETPP